MNWKRILTAQPIEIETYRRRPSIAYYIPWSVWVVVAAALAYGFATH